MLQVFLRSPHTEEEWRSYYHLRWLMLRAPHDQPIGSEKDAFEQQAFHVAAFLGSKEMIGVGRLHVLNDHEGQIRYMAVHKDYKGKSTGRRILSHLEKIGLQQGLSTLILNAREDVVFFYKKAGYSVIGKGPLLFNTIQHKKMAKTLHAILK